jgi:hypothetical protein
MNTNTAVLSSCLSHISSYLPAGWFHEVVSVSACGTGGSNRHFALNFWYQPPDVVSDADADADADADNDIDNSDASTSKR